MIEAPDEKQLGELTARANPALISWLSQCPTRHEVVNLSPQTTLLCHTTSDTSHIDTSNALWVHWTGARTLGSLPLAAQWTLKFHLLMLARLSEWARQKSADPAKLTSPLLRGALLWALMPGSQISIVQHNCADKVRAKSVVGLWPLEGIFKEACDSIKMALVILDALSGSSQQQLDIYVHADTSGDWWNLREQRDQAFSTAKQRELKFRQMWSNTERMYSEAKGLMESHEANKAQLVNLLRQINLELDDVK